MAVGKDGQLGAVRISCTFLGQVKVYELSELSMKFERHMDCEVVQFEILSEDYSKMVFMQVWHLELAKFPVLTLLRSDNT